MSTFLQKRNDEYIRKMHAVRNLAKLLGKLEAFGCAETGPLNFRQVTKLHVAIDHLRDLVDELVKDMPC